MTFGPVSAVVRPGATISAALVGPRGAPGKDGQSIVGPAPFLPAVPWQTLASYVIGPPASYVSIGGSSYVCVVPHTSTTFLSDWNSGFWATVASIGATGQAGSTWYTGSGVPAATTGAVGDYWLRADTGDVFQKGAQGWGQPVANLTGPRGFTGANGNTVNTGLGAPSATVGVNGDSYIDVTPGAPVLWGPKANGVWPSSGTSMVGPAGPGTGSVNPSGTTAPGHLAVFGNNSQTIVDGGVAGLPVQNRLAAAAYAYGAADIGYETRRANGGGAMADTLVPAGTAGLVNGSVMRLHNGDPAGGLLLAAGAGTVLMLGGVQSFVVVTPGRTAELVYDGSVNPPAWRFTGNSMSALLAANALAEIASGGAGAQQAALGNIGALTPGQALALAIAN